MAQAFLKATMVTLGTPVQLKTDGNATKLGVKADKDNAGVIYIGTSTVDQANKIGFPLSPGESYVFDESGYIGVITTEATSLSSYYIDGIATDIVYGEYRV